jgi:hypothetical protein
MRLNQSIFDEQALSEGVRKMINSEEGDASESMLGTSSRLGGVSIVFMG